MIVIAEPLRCSFCGFSKDEVKDLVAGPECFICGDCAELAVEVMRANRRNLDFRSLLEAGY